jgi:ATP-binding cassette subfamily B protein
LICSHRLSSIRNADRIIVFGEACNIVEDGTHNELLARKGSYAKAWKRHLGIDDEEDMPTSLAPLIDIDSA